jgi:hypothetical protein
MTGQTEKAEAFLAIALGAWSGNEQMSGGPEGGGDIKAIGAFKNEPALGGAGMTSAYVQEIDGGVSMHCQTTYRFDEDGSILMTWTPSGGDAQIYTGKLDGRKMRVCHTGEDGMTQTIETDYSEADIASLRATVSGNGIPEMTVFTAVYQRS